MSDPFNSEYNIELNINYPDVDYGYFKNLNIYHNDDDLCKILNNILYDLNCTREISCGRVLMTHYPMYNIRLSNYYYYLLRLDNQILYNTYIDKLIKRHLDNIIFEYEHPYIKSNIDKPKNKPSKKQIPNKFIKQVTTDLFTGETIYIYENFKTGEVIESKNPNLLDELNASKKKERPKKVKYVGVPLDAMTFSFDKPKFKL